MPQKVKNLPAMQETLVQSPGWEDPLETGMATYSNIPAWKIPGVAKSRTQLSDFHFHQYSWASLVAQMVKNLPVMRETWA